MSSLLRRSPSVDSKPSPVFSSGALPDDPTLEREMAAAFGWDDDPAEQDLDEQWAAEQEQRERMRIRGFDPDRLPAA